ncbi:MAG: hypothetical protein HY543_03290 [Deltaproteobacteria bacterium]|nr:hypothetical protein [Deltaproteobacteria bacterium]
MVSGPLNNAYAIACVVALVAASAFAQTTTTTAPATSGTSTSSSSGSSTSTGTATTTTAKPAETPKAAETPKPAEPAKVPEITVKSTPDASPKLPPRPAPKAAEGEGASAEKKAATPEAETSSGPKAAETGEAKPAAPAAPAAETPEEGLPTTERTLVPPSTDPMALYDPGNVSSLLETRISLDLRDLDILDALKYLAAKANLNVVVGPGIAGVVSILLNDVSIKDAIDIILSASRFAYSIRGNIMRVMTEEEFKALYGKEFYDQRETKIIQLKYASTKNVGTMLENVKSAVGRIVYNDATGTIVMTDTPEKIAEMEEVIRHEELPSIVRVPPTASEIFDLQYAKAKDVSEKLTPSLTKDLGKIFLDERVNRLIVSDLPYKIEELRHLVRAFDVKTREVFIEAKIVQVTLNDRFQGGIDWASIANGHFQQTFPLSLNSYGQMTLGSIAPQTATAADGTTSTTFAGSGIIMQFLETFGRANVLSTPQIAVVNGEEAKIMVGSKEAYTTSSVTQSQATTTTAQQVTFVDVGVTLKVTPTINSDGMITMKIKPEVSSVTRFVTTAQGDQIPIVESTNAETIVMVRDGTTVLIGGLMATSRTKTRTGIPVLSRIPVLGSLFRSTEDHSLNSELTILLTPHIMSGEELFPGTRPMAVANVTLPPGKLMAERGPVDSAGSPGADGLTDALPGGVPTEEKKSSKRAGPGRNGLHERYAPRRR